MSHAIAVMYLGKIVEWGDADAVALAPKHPYTQALFAAALPIDLDEPREEVALAGEVPSPLAPPAGCRFHPRCPFAHATLRDGGARAPRGERPPRRLPPVLTMEFAIHRRRAGVRGGRPRDSCASIRPRTFRTTAWTRAMARAPTPSAFIARARRAGLARMTLAARVRRRRRPPCSQADPPRGARARGRALRTARGCWQTADAIIEYGSERSALARCCRAIARGEATFWQGYSEPDAGSDLLSLKTRRGATATTT